MIDYAPNDITDIPKVAKPLPPYVCPMSSNLRFFKWVCMALPTLTLMAIFTALLILLPKRHIETVGAVIPEAIPPTKQGGVIDEEMFIDTRVYPRVINCGDKPC